VCTPNASCQHKCYITNGYISPRLESSCTIYPNLSLHTRITNDKLNSQFSILKSPDTQSYHFSFPMVLPNAMHTYLSNLLPRSSYIITQQAEKGPPQKKGSSSTCRPPRSILALLAGKLLRPALLDGLDTIALVIGIAACKMTVREQLVDDVLAGIVELLIIAHFGKIVPNVSRGWKCGGGASSRRYDVEI
jgi:hypothetical protein